MIGAQFNPTGSFQLLNASFNAKNFPAGAVDAINNKSLSIYWNTVDNTVVAVDKDGIIVYELSSGEGGVKVFRAQLTSDLSPVSVAMTTLENTIYNECSY